MTQQFESPSQAVNVLLQGVQIAQKRGAYELDEAAILSAAVAFLSTPAEASPETDPESEKKTNKKNNK